jgi:predicted Fe-S protein YdhL (DUF1289 family)
MSDDIWQRDEVESPCIRVCLIHPAARLCTGCLRTPEEIAAWSRMPAPERARIMAELPDRKGLLRKRRGGRAARLRTGLARK